MIIGKTFIIKTNEFNHSESIALDLQTLHRLIKWRGIKAVQVNEEDGIYIASVPSLFLYGRLGVGRAGISLFLHKVFWNKVSEAENLKLFEEV